MNQRRSSEDVRREESAPVVLRYGDSELAGVAVESSRRGVRVALRSPLAVGTNVEVTLGGEATRPARVVWVREEESELIAGLEYSSP